jgi:hypothetical protein
MPDLVLLTIGYVSYIYEVLFGRLLGHVYYVQSGGRPLAHLNQYNVTILSMLLSDIRTECPP